MGFLQYYKKYICPLSDNIIKNELRIDKSMLKPINWPVYNV